MGNRILQVFDYGHGQLLGVFIEKADRWFWQTTICDTYADVLDICAETKRLEEPYPGVTKALLSNKRIGGYNIDKFVEVLSPEVSEAKKELEPVEKKMNALTDWVGGGHEASTNANLNNIDSMLKKLYPQLGGNPPVVEFNHPGDADLIGRYRNHGLTADRVAIAAVNRKNMIKEGLKKLEEKRNKAEASMVGWDPYGEDCDW